MGRKGNSVLVTGDYSSEHEPLTLLEQKGSNVINLLPSNMTLLVIVPYQGFTLISVARKLDVLKWQ